MDKRTMIHHPDFGMVPRFLPLPCEGEMAEMDTDSSTGAYRCWTCMAVVGSVGMSKRCQDEWDKLKVIDILKGNR